MSENQVLITVSMLERYMTKDNYKKFIKKIVSSFRNQFDYDGEAIWIMAEFTKGDKPTTDLGEKK